MMNSLRKEWRQLVVPLGLIGLLVILFANRLALSNLILGQGDAFLYFYPYWTAASEAIRAGRIPLWNPEIFMGAPFLANSQIGFFYPLNWPLWLWLPAPYAVSATLVIHLVIAGWGAYLAGRRVWGMGQVPAGIAGILFALGGYIPAQVEHVNQVQVMAWLPWYFVALQPRLSFRHRLAGVTVLFALQLTAGHTQTTFITGVGVGVWLAARHLWPANGSIRIDVRKLVTDFGPMVIGAILAVVLAAIQLLPTLELTGQSSRAGGLSLNEVLSFSLHPLLLSRSLLPGYGQSPFAEYVAFLPISAILLAVVGLWRWRRHQGCKELFILLLLSLFLAFGQFNPFNQLIARLPGFDLFRVPARWLLLYTLAMAMLAGLGWQAIAEAGWRRWRRPLLIGTAAIGLLIGWAYASVPLSQIVPLGPESPAEYPSILTIVGWLLELFLFWLFASGVNFVWWRRSGILVVGGVALFLGTRILAYNNHLTTPDIYFGVRPPIARLQALTQGVEPPGRYLSQSQIFFDLGDQVELDTIYADQLDASSMWTYTVATKQKEVIAPNLSLVYGLSSVDGFDGGILPLSTFTQLTSLLLPDGFATTDGRLREYIQNVPDAHLLDNFNVKYLITDKVGDEWHEAEGLNVFYDRKHAVTLAGEGFLPIGHLPSYEASSVRVLASSMPSAIIFGHAGVAMDTKSLREVGPNQYQADLLTPVSLTSLSIMNDSAEPIEVWGVALIDVRDHTFQALVPGEYRLIYSGDVKIYENLDARPRAYVVETWQMHEDGGITTPLMSLATTQQARWSGLENRAEITEYRPEYVEIRVNGDRPGMLVLADASFPGWLATVNGEPVEIRPVDGFFRGVAVPAGEVIVEMTYQPVSYQRGRAISLAGLIIVVALIGDSIRRLE